MLRITFFFNMINMNKINMIISRWSFLSVFFGIILVFIRLSSSLQWLPGIELHWQF